MINHVSVNEAKDVVLNLLNAALKAKNLINSSQSTKYSNCISIDLKLENCHVQFKGESIWFFLVTIILENLKGI